MKTYRAGQKVEYGIYVAPKALDARFVGADGETLNGKAGAEYTHLPSILLVLAAPVMGGVFVLAFPLIIIFSIIGVVGTMMTKAVKSAFESRVHLTQMRWEPAAAYLNKSNRSKKADGKEQKEAKDLDDLKKEVNQKRNN